MSMDAGNFKLIRPIEITGSVLTSSTVPEAVAATWSSGTTYALGDRAGLAPVGGDPQTVYQSKQAGNLNHALTDTDWWYPVGIVYPAYAPGTTYNIGDIVSDLTNHLLYESIASGHTGTPLTNTTKWTNIGPTNRWKMFDVKYSTQSVEAESMTVVLTPGQLVNSLALLNCQGASATVTQSVSGYSRTISLVTHDVLSWYDFFYETPIRTGDAIFDDIPPYPASTLTVEIDNEGGDAKVGIMVAGKFKTIGATQWGFVRSINDYSRTVEADDGSVTLVRGNYAKRLLLNVEIPRGFESEATRVLEEFRATELVFVGYTECSMSIIWGILGAWNVPKEIDGRTADIEIKGLI